jgi:PAS domain S-box-containing protein
MHVPVTTLTLSLLVFSHLHFRAGRLWVAYLSMGLRLLALALNFLSETNLNFTRIVALDQLPLPGGGFAATPVGEVNPWIVTGQSSGWLLCLFVLDGAISEWRRDRQARSKTLMVAICLMLAMIFSIANSMMISLGLIQFPFFFGIFILPFMALIGLAISGETFRSKSLLTLLHQSEVDIIQARHRMQMVMDSSGVGLWEWNVARDEIWMSDVARQQYRPDAEMPSFEHFLETVHVDDREPLRKHVMSSLGKGGAFQREYRLRTDDGSARWILTQGRLERDEPEGILMRGISIDITERKAADDRLRKIIDAAPVGMIITNADGIVILVNRQIHADFGYDGDALLGQSIELLIPGRFHHRHREHMRDYVHALQPRPMAMGREVSGVTAAGAEIPLEITLNPLGDGADSAVYILVSIANISSRKRAELELAQQRNELAHLSRVMMLSEMSGSLAHELNQPLAAILSNAQAALRFMSRGNPDLDEIRSILQDIVSNDKRAGEVIKNLRLMLKKGEAARDLVSINDLVADVLHLMRSDMLNMGVTVALELAGHLPRIMGISVQLQQVMINLMANACDAMADMPAEKRRLVVTTKQRQDDSIIIGIRDNGPGIALPDINQVFEPFYTTKPEGMGLGLAVCRRIIEAHGGAIRVTSDPSGGTTFYISIPRHKENEA